jgi:hypothetical protein
MPHDTRWHDKSIPELTTRLTTDVMQGLTPQEAAARLQQVGANELRKGKTILR